MGFLSNWDPTRRVPAAWTISVGGLGWDYKETNLNNRAYDQFSEMIVSSLFDYMRSASMATNKLALTFWMNMFAKG